MNSGRFVRDGHPTEATKAKIKAGVKRHWDTTRVRSDKIMAAKKKAEEIAAWAQAELAKARAKIETSK